MQSLSRGRHLRTCWDLLKPDPSQNIRQRQAKQKEQHDQHARFRRFATGQSVVAKNFGSGESWIAGVITQQLGPLIYLVDVSRGRIWKRHVDHLKELDPPPSSPAAVPDTEIDIDIDTSSHSTSTGAEEASDAMVPPEPINDTNSGAGDVVTTEPGSSPSPESTPQNAATPITPETTSTPPRRYPSRSY
jgi:hypothetical protein